MSTRSETRAFFQQSAWMVTATIAGGFCMMAVHTFAGYMQPAEYGVFQTLLQVTNLLLIPSIGLQTVFARQAAAAVNESLLWELAAITRGVFKALFFLWLVVVFGVVLLHSQILATLKIQNPASLWLTLVVALFSLWLPMMLGLLQGAHKFSWFGAIQVLNGVGRLASIACLVAWLGGQSAAAMTGVLLGLMISLACGLSQCRIFGKSIEPYRAWKPWLKEVIPLSLGAGAVMFLLSADMIVVQAVFEGDQTGYYAAAGMIGRALLFLTVPMTAVMFPKVVRSAALSQDTRVVMQALVATAFLSGSAAIACTLFPRLPLLVLYYGKEEFLTMAHLVPWFAWGMLPLTLANVLVNNLLARKQFAIVPWLVLVAAGYGVALVACCSSFLNVVKTLGTFSTVLLAVALIFTLRQRGASTERQIQTGSPA